MIADLASDRRHEILLPGEGEGWVDHISHRGSIEFHQCADQRHAALQVSGQRSDRLLTLDLASGTFTDDPLPDLYGWEASGDLFFRGERGAPVQVFDREGRLLATLPPHTGGGPVFRRATVSPDGELVHLGDHLWKRDNWEPVLSMPTATQWSEDWSLAVVPLNGGAMEIVDLDFWSAPASFDPQRNYAQRILAELAMQRGSGRTADATTGLELPPELPTVLVNDTQELHSALERASSEPGTTIELAPGEYCIDREFLQRESATLHRAKFYPYDSLILDGVSELTLRSATPTDPARLTSSVPDSSVLAFENCHEIRLCNLRIGHTQDVSDTCVSAVLRLLNCPTVEIRDCDLYGCGTHGLFVSGGSDLEVFDSTLHHCTASFAYLDRTSVLFQDVRFEDCSGWIGLEALHSTVTVERGTFQSNRFGDALFQSKGEGWITVENSEFRDNVCPVLGIPVAGQRFEGNRFGEESVDPDR